MLDLIVCGVAGRMGGTLVRVIKQTPGVKLVGALDRPGSPRVGKDAGELVGVGKLGVPISDRFESKLKGEVALIDFSRPVASLGFLKESARRGLPIVIGTTGFTQKEWSTIKRLGRSTRALVAATMSICLTIVSRTGLVPTSDSAWWSAKTSSIRSKFSRLSRSRSETARTSAIKQPRPSRSTDEAATSASRNRPLLVRHDN